MFEINKIKPFVVEIANNDEEFIKIQNKLLSIGYKWLVNKLNVDDDGIIKYSPIEYPIVVTNWLGSSRCVMATRQ